MSLDYVPADIWSEVLGYCDRSALPSYCLVSTNFNLGATAALYRSISLNTKRARQFCDNASHRIPLIRHLKAFIYVNGHSEHSLRDEDAWLSLLRGLKAASTLQTLDIMGRSEIHSLPLTTPAIVNMLVSLSDLPSLRNVSSKLHFPSKYGTPDIVTCWGTLLKGLTLSTDQHLCPLVWDKTPPHPSHRPKLKTLICYGLPSPWNDVEKFFDLGSVSHFAIMVRSSTFIPHDTISNNIVDALKTSTDRLEILVISSKSWDIDDSNLLLPTDFKVFSPSLTTLAIFGSEISKTAQFSALLTFIQCITSQSPSLATLKLHFHVDEYEIYLPSCPSWIIPPSHPSWITLAQSLCELDQVQILELFFEQGIRDTRGHSVFFKHLEQVFSRFARCEGTLKLHWDGREPLNARGLHFQSMSQYLGSKYGRFSESPWSSRSHGMTIVSNIIIAFKLSRKIVHGLDKENGIDFEDSAKQNK